MRCISRPRGLWTGALLCGLLALGCQHSSGPTSAPADSAVVPATASFAMTPRHQALTGQYRLAIDLATLEGTVIPIAGRVASGFQAQTFDLDIANFQTPSSFRLRSIAREPEGDLTIAFTHAHPFAAPNLNAPPTAKNRADLSYTGRLLILGDVAPAEIPEATFFAGDPSPVIANTALVNGPDGYVSTGDLLAAGGFTANTFPYVLLADEAQNNRLGVTNNLEPTGNYPDTFGGWQRATLGNEAIGWTGYDFVHAGQTITNQFTIDVAALTGQSLSLDVALLIKYTTPSGAPPRTNRALHFPQEQAAVAAFAYRLPFAALDASVISSPDALELPALAGAEVPLLAFVRDWDTRANVSTAAFLSDESDITLVPPGTAGAPMAQFDVPGLAAAPITLLVADGLATGLPGEEVPYAGTLTNVTGTAPVGRYPGLLRLIDPEDGAASSAAYRFGVDPLTLVSDPNRALAVRTYQAVAIDVIDPLPVITAVLPTGVVGVSGAHVTFSATATGSPTTWSWDFATGAVPDLSSDATPLVALEIPGLYAGTVTATNTYGTSAPFEFTYSVGVPTVPSFAKHLIDDVGQVGRFGNVVSYGTGYAVSYSELGTGGLPHLAVTTNPEPTSAADWTISIIDPAAGTSAIYNSLIEHNGRLLVAYYSGNPDQDLKFARATNVAPAAPGPFTTYVIDGVGNAGLDVSLLATSTGNLMAVYRRTTPAPGTIKFARSTIADPLAPANWTSYDAVTLADFGVASGSFFLGSRLAVNNGNPAFTFAVPTTAAVRGLWVAQASIAEPITPFDWTLQNVENTGTTILYSSCAVAGDRLAVCYNDAAPDQALKFARALVPLPASSGDWSTPIVLQSAVGSDVGQHCIMDRINGRLAVVFYENDALGNGNFHIARALATRPTTLGDWQWGTIEAGGGVTDPGEFGHGLLDAEGRITLVYNEDVGDDLWFARAAAAW